jgi:hypothetical protein
LHALINDETMGVGTILPSWLVAALNAGAATLLINAGVLKIASPDPLKDALGELARGRILPVGRSLVRVAATAEIAAAFLLLEAHTRIPATYAVAFLGLCFVGLGIAGTMRHSTLPCGCLGGRGTTPLGVENVVLGMVLVADLPVNVLAASSPTVGAVFSTIAISIVALTTVSLGMWSHRAGAAIFARAVPQLVDPIRRIRD